MSLLVDIEKKLGAFTLHAQFETSGGIMALLGASGSGKSVTLKCIAGIMTPDRGRIVLDGKTLFDSEARVNLTPQQRRVGYLFQQYALFPNMTVMQNILCGVRSGTKAERRRKVQDSLRRFRLEGLEKKYPAQFSGGQQQRVALARALVIQPDVLLMDEPLSNLDAKLRVEMRTVIKEIQKQVGITTVYVTHDQEEAMAISDRIAVLSAGTIHHCGEPKNIYQRPADLFVATFIGKSNLLSAKLVAEDGKGVLTFQNGYSVVIPDVRPDEIRDRDVTLSVRPEEMHVSLCRDKSSQPGLHGTIRDSVFLGSNTHYFVDLETGEPVEIIQESEIDSILPPGSKVVLTLREKKVNLFDSESTKSIMSGIRNSAVPAEEG